MIVANVGDGDSFVAGVAEVNSAKKVGGDYHQEMYRTCIQDWFLEKLLSKLKLSSVIAMDNVSCHSVKVQIVSSSRGTRTQLVGWFCRYGVLLGGTLLKANVVRQVDKLKVALPGLKQCLMDSIGKCK